MHARVRGAIAQPTDPDCLVELGRKCREARLRYEEAQREWVDRFRCSRQVWHDDGHPNIISEREAYAKYKVLERGWMIARQVLVAEAEGKA